MVQASVARTFPIFCTIKERTVSQTAMGVAKTEEDTDPPQVLLPCRYQPMRSRELHSDLDVNRDYLRGWVFAAAGTYFPELGVVYLYEPDKTTQIGEFEVQQSTHIDSSDRFESKALVTQRQTS